MTRSLAALHGRILTGSGLRLIDHQPPMCCAAMKSKTMQGNDLVQILALVGDGAWAVDAHHRIILWNHAARELLGHSAAESVGQLCFQLVAGQDLDGPPV